MFILSNNTKTKAIDHLETLRLKKPLVHCITNRVTMTECANGLLASGAAPIMAEDVREVENIVSISQALVINIGTLMPLQVEAMIKAGKKAKAIGVPVIFDPVGAGATPLRDSVSKQILEEVKPDIIRGNMSEIRALYGFDGQTKGVEAAASDYVTFENAETAAKTVEELAKRYGCIVGATGKIDIVSDGENTYFIENGHEMLCKITGSGCVLSSLVGGFAGAAKRNDYLMSTVSAFVLNGLSGEMAFEFVEKTGQGLGTFREKVMDYLYLIGRTEMDAGAKIYVLEK
ncbi:hydroxyethylthiazole kinase [Methanolapillus millepedarum]|uniref:Hydroxyethylthiazole kinase n=1 Tax=Methanolapillus millepedarum TaxID=3028296 RepID=A0AA96V1L2_9EURY|nr:Hydroxyethylthiazole kinase [Methanosarcinaceae archaeon Ac7]